MRKLVLVIMLTVSAGLMAQVQTEVPPVVPNAKPVAVEHIKIHGTALEGNLEGDAVDRELMRKELLEWLAQLELTETMLDGDFPQACDAHQNVVVGMLNDATNLLAETGIS